MEDSRYDQTLIQAMVVIAYLGWAAYGATTILLPNQPPSFNTTISGVALVVLGASWTLFAIQKYPSTFYVYVVFPCYFWRETLVASSGPLLDLYHSGKLRGGMRLIPRVIMVIVGLQSMVVRVVAPSSEGNLRLTSAIRSGTLIGVSGVLGSWSLDSYGPPGAGRSGFWKNILWRV